MKSRYLRTTITLAIFMMILSGCTAQRYITPTLTETPRTGLDLKPPVLCSVLDGRANQEPKNAAAQLAEDLKRIYGSSTEWNDYFAKTPYGRVSVRVRLITLGATFGSRLVSTTAFANAVGSAQGNASGSWGTVAGNISTQQSMLAGSFSGEGWWNGAAWIDLEVQDYRGAKPINFTLPIVAEHREPNAWGYSSGDKAAQIAWQRVSVQLTRAMDTIFRTIRDDQL